MPAPFAGFFLYHPSRKQQPAALVAVIETFGKLLFSLYLLFIRKEDGKGSTTFTLHSLRRPEIAARPCRNLLPDPLSGDGARRVNQR